MSPAQTEFVRRARKHKHTPTNANDCSVCEAWAIIESFPAKVAA